MLSHFRQAFTPTLPDLLKELKTVAFDSKEVDVATPPIQKLFPKTANQKLLVAKKGSPKPFSPLKIGAVFSGGQASGGHNVMTGLFDALQVLHPQSELYGFLDGPSGIVSGKTLLLTANHIAPFRNQGGFDLLGSGRTKIETPEQLQGAATSVKNLNLDGLVVIGGDDSNTNAAIIAEYFLSQNIKTRVIGVPKTIDGDLQNPHVAISFGFDTATKIYSELIGNIAKDALSAKKYYHFIKLMGRSASHIALECALKTHPNAVLISEERKTLAQITTFLADLISLRFEKSKNYGIILIPEGILEFMPEMKTLIQEIDNPSPASKAVFDALPKRVQQQLLLDKDPHGNVNLSAVETEILLIESVQNELKKRNFPGKFNPLPHFFGYEGRAGLPSNFDANYCYALGHTAALLIAHGYSSYMTCIGNLTKPPSSWSCGGIPLTSLLHLEERKGKQKPVIAKAYVDLNGKAYQKLSSEWAMSDDYQCPGPIQFFGDPKVTDSIPMMLQG
jgi:pyrophosphate--fructose-6-phosphate 1-phosphotransferase